MEYVRGWYCGEFEQDVDKESWRMARSMGIGDVVVWRVLAADAAVEVFNTAAVGLDYLPNAADLVELDLELVDLAQDLVEAGDLGVGIRNEVSGAVVLHGSGRLGLFGELGGSDKGGADRGLAELTWDQRCWMLCSRRSKWVLNACRLDGSSSRRP